MPQEENQIRECLIAAMKNVFGTDRRRVHHALRVLEHAQEILSQEGGSPLVVEAAAILHDIGIPEAERKYGSSAGKYQEIEGPPIAGKILERVGLDAQVIEHVCRIIANHHSARGIDTLEFRIVCDADRLVNIADDYAGRSHNRLKSLIDRVFKTATGKRKAYELFMES